MVLGEGKEGGGGRCTHLALVYYGLEGRRLQIQKLVCSPHCNDYIL